MNNQRKLRMIKIIYWVGVLADAIWTLALVWPRLFALLTGRTLLGTDLTTQLIAGTAASLMAGWTVLLAWAVQKPIDRRAVLAMTAVPVVTGIFGVTLVGYIIQQGAPPWILFKTAGIAVAMLWAFVAANRIAKDNHHEISH